MKCWIDSIFDAKRDGINVSQMCRELGITRAYWYKVIKSECEPTVTLAIKITDYLNRCLAKGGYSENLYSVADLWTD